MGEILDMLAAGNYWPALAAGLMLLTHLVRKGGADRMLLALAARIPGDDARQLSHLRAWIPIALALAAWVVAVALPLDVSMRDTAHALLLATIAAMAGYDLVMASGTLAKAAGARQEPVAGPPMVTAGVDVQADRFVYEIIVWHTDGSERGGYKGEISAKTSDPVEWRALDAIMTRTFDGATIARLAIDCGYQAPRVYEWVERHRDRAIAWKGILPTDGVSDARALALLAAQATGGGQ